MTYKNDYYQKNRSKILEKQKQKRLFKYNSGIEGYDYIHCKECGLKGSDLGSHITKIHNMSVGDYKLKHNVDSVKCKRTRDSFRGENNPAYQHGGKFSPFSNKYIHFTPETKERAMLAVRKTKKENPHRETTKIEFYLAKGLSLEEAQEALSKRQSTFSLEKCTQKHGEEKGKKKWKDRQTRWQNTLMSKSGEEISEINSRKFPKISAISKVEKDLFSELSKFCEITNQHKIKYGSRWFFYDIVNKDKNKIIEFNGDFWHANPLLYKESDTVKIPGNPKLAGDIWRGDRKKKLIAERKGFQVMVVWERDYRSNKERVIQECLNFLTP